MRRAPWRTLAALASFERGALLWLPGLLLAVAVTLFAMRTAPAGVSLFTRTTSLRIVLGPCIAEGANTVESASFLGALRRSLARWGDLSLADSSRVARRLETLGSPAAAAIPDSLLHAVRPLNPHLMLRLELRRAANLWRARAEAWDVHDGQCSFAVEAASERPEVLGAVLAESLGVALHRPRAGLDAGHSAAPEPRSSRIER